MLTEQQRLERRKGIGGSDVAAILGISPWKTALDVYREKVEGWEPEFSEKQKLRMAMGDAAEGKLLEHYIELNSLRGPDILADKTYRPNILIGRYCKPRENKIYDYFKANIDGIHEDDDHNIIELLECKYVHFDRRKEWGESGSEDIPLYYATQAAFYLYVTDAQTCRFLCYIDGEYREYFYHRDTEFENAMLERLHHFWNENVLKQIPPEPVSDSDFFYSFKKKEKEKRLVNKGIDIHIESYRKLKDKISELEKVKNECRNIIINEIEGPGELISKETGEVLGEIRIQKTNRFDGARFKKDHPDLHKQYLKETESLVLKIKGEDNERNSDSN